MGKEDCSKKQILVLQEKTQLTINNNLEIPF